MAASSNNKNLAKNTIFLYIRMFLIMGVTLYTSRVILKVLGFEDFGIYNVVAGIVILFNFINTALSIASQRYLSFALGKNDISEVKKVFSISMTSHIAIAILILILSETIGLYFLYKLNFPPSRQGIIIWVYQLAVLNSCINILRVPYNATIIAYEKMSFFAIIGIIEVFLRLGIVFLLVELPGDKLIVYSLLLVAVTIIVNYIYKIYCNKKFSTSKYQFFWDSKRFKEFASFSGWSLLGSVANISAQQGLNMVINVFCGVIVNAAVGVMNQVIAAVSGFLSNFQTAFNPQLVKSYASGDNQTFFNLIFKTSKFSYYLMLLIALPVILNCDFILNIWLDSVPEYASEFSSLMIIFMLIDAISGPLWISVQATGKIKNYQIIMSILIMLNIPVAIILMKMGLSPIYIFWGRIIINIITLIVRIFYLKGLINLPSKKFTIEVIGIISIVTILIIPVPLYLSYVFEDGWMKFSITTACSIIISFIMIYFIGLNKDEKVFVKEIVLKKILKR